MATGHRWVALLRGINVGGANRLPMADLRATAESLAWVDVATHIQSGNLVASTPAGSTEAQLAASLRDAIRDRHGLDVAVVVRSASDLARIAEAHPGLAGPVEPKLLHVVLLDEAPSPGAVDRVDRDRFLPDTWVLDGREVYVSYPDGSGRSKLTIDVFERAWERSATARNVNSLRQIARLAAS